jgi:phospholipid/cholesterol/gamma-HCH transport system permease protein
MQAVINVFERTGSALLAVTGTAGRALFLLGGSLRFLPRVMGVRKQLWRQLDRAGFGSILVLALISGLTGMIMALQTGMELEKFGVIDRLGAIIGATFCRELGPIWAAVIVLSRVGAAMAAELGTMVVNEEVEALRVMNIDPRRYLVLPRLLALVISMPLLTAIADLVGLFGGALISSTNFGLPIATFFNSAQSLLDGPDFYSGLIKGAIFGVIIAVVACERGLNVTGGAEGVGRATTSSVVINVVFVLIADLILGALYYVSQQAGWV